jgi:hypothetical protein
LRKIRDIKPKPPRGHKDRYVDPFETIKIAKSVKDVKKYGLEKEYDTYLNAPSEDEDD